MIQRCQPLFLCFALVCILGSPGSSALWAKVLELPHQRQLEVDRLRIELGDAEIAVEVTAEKAPSLRLTSLAQAADGTAVETQLELTAEAGGWKLARPAIDGPVQRVRIELSLKPDQSLEVQGENLDIVAQNAVVPDPLADREAQDDDEDVPDGEDDEGGEIRLALKGSGDDSEDSEDLEDLEDSGGTEEEDEGAGGGRVLGESQPVAAAPPAAEAASFRYRLQLVSSQLNALALEDLEIEADDSWIRLDRTSGTLQLTANNGSLAVEQHRGDLDLLATDSEITVGSCMGKTQADLLGGSLVAQGGNGQLTIKSEDTSLRLVGHRGVSSLQGMRSTIDVRELTGFGRATIHSQDSQVTLAESTGNFFVQQNGGRLDARDLRGTTQLAARADAAVELTDVFGKVTLQGEESRFVLARLPSTVEATLNQSALDLQEVGYLAVQGRGSEVTGRDITTLRKLEMVESTVNLDLSKLQGQVAVRFSGDSDAEIELSAPCVVHVKGDNASERVDVSGCQLQAAELSGARNHHISRNLRPSTTLNVTLDSNVSLSVRGR